MDLAEIIRAVNHLWLDHDDYESAHATEDRLYTRFVQHVAVSGPEDLSAMAKKILETKSIDFPRYSA